MTDNEDQNRIYGIIKGADRVVNFAAALLILLLLAYSAYSIWYSSSLKRGSFISDELAQYRPDGDEPTLSDLMKLNPDVNAWITINGTHIDYPVVQGEDDTEYLNRNALGEFSLAGTIFLSSLNKRDFSDSYSMLYGHHIEGGAMFTDILEFRDASFFSKHLYGTLWFVNKAERIEIFACADASAADEIIYNDFGLITADNIPSLITHIKEISTQYREIGIKEDDRILAMSTCEDAVSFDRVLLFGRLRPMTKEELIEAQNAEKEGAGSVDDRAASDRFREDKRILLTVIMIFIAILLFIFILMLSAKNRAIGNNNNRPKKSR